MLSCRLMRKQKLIVASFAACLALSSAAQAQPGPLPRWLVERETSVDLGVAHRYDRFDDGADPWNETQVTLAVRGSRGLIGLRVHDARRLGGRDQLLEIEAAPRLGSQTYAHLAAATSLDAMFYPKRRLAADIYQAIGDGVEVTGGLRRITSGRGADEVVNIYTGGAHWSDGAWLLGGRLWWAPESNRDPVTVDSMLRFYRADGVSFVGIRGSRGRYRDDDRALPDVFSSRTTVGTIEAAQQVGRWLWMMGVGLRREPTFNRNDLDGRSQITAQVGVRLRIRGPRRPPAG